MKSWLLQHLACPFCRDALQEQRTLEREDGEIRYGLLECAGCNRTFPVVEGIPLLGAPETRLDAYRETTREVVVPGPRLRAVVDAVERGDALEALSLLLNPTDLCSPSWTFDPTHRSPRTTFDGEVSPDMARPPIAGERGWRRRLREALRVHYRRLRASHRLRMAPRWRRRLAALFRRDRERLCARELFDLFYRHYSGAGGIATYFEYRFGQPRHLAALCALAPLRGSDGVIVDLACGAGHLAHYLAFDRAQPRVIGIDREFVRLLIARHWMAPSAGFVCMPADGPLPLATRSVAAVFCSDAFHYLRDKQAATHEITRVLHEEGALVLTRVANARHEPHEGYELTLAEYRNLFPDFRVSSWAEQHLVERYLRSRGPDLSVSGDLDEVEEQKWLTLFVSRSASFFREYGAFEHLPHAVGRPSINPLYLQRARPDGGVDLTFRFPNEWYAFEDAGYRDYAPPTGRLSSEAVRALVSGQWNAELGEAARTWTVIGVPARFGFAPVGAP